MDANDVLALGLGLNAPWRLVDQRLDTDEQPHELRIDLAADRGGPFTCPDCEKPSRPPISPSSLGGI